MFILRPRIKPPVHLRIKRESTRRGGIREARVILDSRANTDPRCTDPLAVISTHPSTHHHTHHSTHHITVREVIATLSRDLTVHQEGVRGHSSRYTGHSTHTE